MRRSTLLGLVAAVTSGVAALAGTPGAVAAPSPGVPVVRGVQQQHVVVTGVPGADAEVAAAVAAAGGRVTRRLPIVSGVAATLPAGSVPALASAPGVRSVTPDSTGHLQAVDPALGYDVTRDEGSLFFAAQVVHATQAWGKGVTGKGIDVALIDSGVVPVAGLDTGNVVMGPDLSVESQDPDAQGLDTFGHGTHMASIIAGRDAVSTGSGYADGTTHRFSGIAPDARLVSVKVAASHGVADVSQVIAGIDWVTQHAHTDGLNIRVLNLSYGTDSVQAAALDPLDLAVENAWRAGIVVVVSAGNDGTNRLTLADPANDPMVVAVGADDPNGTVSVGDDVIPAFSQRGTADRGVDVIAPGVHLLGLRDPGSDVDAENPGAVVGSRFFRGSGTSQAAAVVSGVSALYLSKYPTATPDQVKDALRHNATPPTYAKKLWAGLGVPSVDKMIGYAPSPKLVPQVGLATGLGSLEGARGSAHVSDGVSTLAGEQDVFGRPWVATDWAQASTAGTSWDGGSWNGSVWAGSGWATPTRWSSVTWSGSDWASKTWSGTTWTSKTWSGSSWDSKTWSSTTWSDWTWDSKTWSSTTWSSTTWSSKTWSGSTWSAAAWR